MTTLVTGLGELAEEYDTLFCDVWGVVHDGVAAFPGACAALARWKDEVGPVILISNAPRPEAAVAVQLQGLGAPPAAWSAIVTSGDVCRALLAERAPGPAWRLGPPKDDPLFEGLGVNYVPMEAARFIACSGPFDEDVETPEDYRAVFVEAVARGLPMICANPDLVVQRGDRLIYCAGALAALYRELGGEVIEAGKPYPPIYDLARSRADGLGGNRILTIGDAVATDLAGARAQGLDALFVADGIHRAELLHPAGGPDLAALARLTGEPAPRWAMRALVW